MEHSACEEKRQQQSQDKILFRTQAARQTPEIEVQITHTQLRVCCSLARAAVQSC